MMPLQQQTLGDLLPNIGALIIALTGFLTAAAAWLAARTARGVRNVQQPMSATQSVYTQSLDHISKAFVSEILKLTQERVNIEISLNTRVQTLEQEVKDQQARLKTVEEQLESERDEKVALLKERTQLKQSVAVLNAKITYLRRVIENEGFKVSTEELRRIEEQVQDEGNKA